MRIIHRHSQIWCSGNNGYFKECHNIFKDRASSNTIYVSSFIIITYNDLCKKHTYFTTLTCNGKKCDKSKSSFIIIIIFFKGIINQTKIKFVNSSIKIENFTKSNIIEFVCMLWKRSDRILDHLFKIELNWTKSHK